MNKIAAIMAALLLQAALPLATSAQTPPIDGQVTRIDLTQNKITLRHGPIKKFDMDQGMTMVFRVKDPAMLKQVKVGDKVKFDAEHTNGQYIVTRMQKTK